MPQPSKITVNWLELSPAYGRDYKTGKSAREAFYKGEDWRVHGMNNQGQQGPFETLGSIRDFHPGIQVILRYKQQTMTTAVTVPTKV